MSWYIHPSKQLRDDELPPELVVTIGVTNHLRKASIANLRNDEDREREEVAMAHDLLSEVMGA